VNRDVRRLLPVLFDLMVAGWVALFSLLDIGSRGDQWPLASVGFGMAVAVGFRRRWPLAVMAVVAALALLQVLAFPKVTDPRPYDIAVLIAMYSVVKYGRRLAEGLLAAGVVAIGIVIEVVRARVEMWWAPAVFYVAVCATVWLTAYTIRTRRLYVATLEERASTAERERDHLARLAVADERAAIARELHDVVAHSLAVMIVQADGASYTLDADKEQARTALGAIGATGRDALEDMRRLVALLRGTGDGGDLAPERRRVAMDQLDVLVERARSAGLGVDVTHEGASPHLAPGEELTIYRVVQEALTNALRHAGSGAKAELVLRYSAEAVEVSIVDDGAGRRHDTPDRPGGHGLVGMRERVAVHNGTCAVGPLPEGGWRVWVRLPVRRAGEVVS
jgi:signal transduction histidine kinase